MTCVQDALTSAIEEMRLMRRTVESAESAAQQAKKAALNGGVDILAKVDEMHLMLERARAANETVLSGCTLSFSCNFTIGI
jgi:hypothetical protein